MKIKKFIPILLALLSFSVYIADMTFKLERFALLQNEVLEFVLLLILLFYLPIKVELEKMNLQLLATSLILMLLATVKWEFDSWLYVMLHTVCYIILFTILFVIKNKEEIVETN